MPREASPLRLSKRARCAFGDAKAQRLRVLEARCRRSRGSARWETPDAGIDEQTVARIRSTANAFRAARSRKDESCKTKPILPGLPSLRRALRVWVTKSAAR